MKHLKFLFLVFAAGMVFGACQHLGSKSEGSPRSERSVRDFLPGTFVNNAKGEYSLAHDTLLIQPMDAGSDAYRIYRSIAFQRIENGKLMRTQRRTEVMTAVYDEKTRSMLESKKGKVITIYPDSGLIVVGSREYRKLEKE